MSAVFSREMLMHYEEVGAVGAIADALAELGEARADLKARSWGTPGYDAALHGDAHARLLRAQEHVERIADTSVEPDAVERVGDGCGMVRIADRDLRRLYRERDEARESATSHQERMNEMVEARPTRRVRAFMLRFDHPVAATPHVPETDRVRFRLSLITEEYCELMRACGVSLTAPAHSPAAHDIETILKWRIQEPIEVDLPELADAMADLDYVVEGTRITCGVDGEAVAALVHAANMAKEPAQVAAKDEHHARGGAKPTKPEGWRPPDVARELERQGWRR